VGELDKEMEMRKKRAQEVREHHEQQVSEEVRLRRKEELLGKRRLVQRWLDEVNSGPACDPAPEALQGEAPRRLPVSEAIRDQLTPEQRQNLAKRIAELEPLMVDPRVVPKRPGAKELPIAVRLDIDPTVKPFTAGAARTFPADKAEEASKQTDTLLAGNMIEQDDNP
jgi:hypothetical protein